MLVGTNTCDLLVTGIDRHADLLTGGLDGLYRLVSCFDGKPWYRRLAGPPGEPRSLFYNEFYGDWQFSSSEEPSEVRARRGAAVVVSRCCRPWLKWSLGIWVSGRLPLHAGRCSNRILQQGGSWWLAGCTCAQVQR